jgi:hypothetical protein
MWFTCETAELDLAAAFRKTPKMMLVPSGEIWAVTSYRP